MTEEAVIYEGAPPEYANGWRSTALDPPPDTFRVPVVAVFRVAGWVPYDNDGWAVVVVAAREARLRARLYPLWQPLELPSPADCESALKRAKG